MDKKEYYSIPELAKLMGISRVAVFKKVKNGTIKAGKMGKAYMISHKDAGDFISEEEPALYGEMKIFNEENGGFELEVKLHNETVWLNLNQMSALFGRDKSVISRHIDNVFREGELDSGSVVAKFATTASDGKKYNVDYYNMDVVISVGYRVKSQAGVRFRIWASGVLKRYIKDGYAVNIKRMERELKGLKKLKSVVGALGAAVKLPGSIGMEVELINLISGYSGSLEILQDYDDMALKSTGKLTPTYELKFEEALSVVEMAKKEYKKGSAFFGTGPMSKLKSIIGAINQTFDGKDLYPTVEEKASHLLYFAVKDHPFTDGNKRLAAILFLHYMSKNGMLYLNKGEKRVSDGALAALTLLAAVSSPKEKEIMINVITNVIRTGG